jgi:hypothetical protein
MNRIARIASTALLTAGLVVLLDALMWLVGGRRRDFPPST